MAKTVNSLHSLEKLCLTHIVMTLEEYTDEELALLPKRFREQLLYSIAVVDVCRLENTQFTSGIVVNLVWKHLYKEHISENARVTSDCWKDKLFIIITRSIFRDPALVFTIINPNLLLAVKYESNIKAVKTVPRQHSAQKKFVHWAPHKEKLFIPSRYEKFFHQGDQIPDAVALELISSRCHFRPKKIDVSLELLIKHLAIAEFLSEFFEKVESLNIMENQHPSFSSEALSELLRLAFQCNAGKLSSLSIALMDKFDTADDALCSGNAIVDAISSVFSSHYSGLKNLSLFACGYVALDLQKLIAVTEYQSQLQTISIRFTERIRGHSPQFSMTLLTTWFRRCFEKPTFQQLNFCFIPISKHLFTEILTTFLSTPCTHEQTIKFHTLVFKKDDDQNSEIGRKDSRILRKVKKWSKKKTFDVVAVPYQFDDLSTRYKSITFDSCYFDALVESFQKVQCLKIKHLSILRIQIPLEASTDDPFIANIDGHSERIESLDCSPLVSQIVQHNIESLEMALISMKYFTLSNYDSLLKKNSLKTVKFFRCIDMDPVIIRKAAKEQKFKITEEVEYLKAHRYITEFFTFILNKE